MKSGDVPVPRPPERVSLQTGDGRALARGLSTLLRGMVVIVASYLMLFPGCLLLGELALGGSAIAILIGGVLCVVGLTRLRRRPVDGMWVRYLGFARICSLLPVAGALALFDSVPRRGMVAAAGAAVIVFPGVYLGTCLAFGRLALRLKCAGSTLARFEEARRAIIVNYALSIAAYGVIAELALNSSRLTSYSSAVVLLVVVAILYVVVFVPYPLVKLGTLSDILRFEVLLRTEPATRRRTGGTGGVQAGPPPAAPDATVSPPGRTDDIDP